MQILSESRKAGKRVVEEFSEKNVTFMAAGIAYNAFVSLAPLLILLLLAVSLVGEGLQERLITTFEGSLPGPIADVVVQIFAADTATTGMSVVGLVVLLWGTLKIFRGLDTAFSEIYETEERNSFVDQLVDGSVVLVSLVVSIVATIAVTTVFSSVAGRIPFLGVLTPTVLVVGLVVAFSPMYYRFPDTELGWRDVLPGTVVAALGWAALQSLFQVYLLFKGDGSGGFFGGVILVVTWLYFSGLVLLLGAVLNAVISGHASGAAGGVGRGAGNGGDDVETRSERSLDRGELATYLQSLREQLTGHYTEMRPTTGAGRTDGHAGNDRVVPTPLGSSPSEEVEVVETTRTGDDGRERSVTLRWRTDDAADAEPADD